MIVLKRSQNQVISFVMCDASGVAVPGLGGGGLTVQLSKAGAAFQAGVGAKSEIGLGWYTYTVTAAESDTLGPLAVISDGAGCITQNMLFFVQSPTITAVEFIYNMTDSTTLLPLPGVEVWVTSDALGNVDIDHGYTDAFGNVTFYLNPGTYYLWRTKSGYSFSNPDTEIIT